MKYKIIYADPPWPYDNQQSHDPARGGYTYRPMSLECIKSLPLLDIADDNCTLFLWATEPKGTMPYEVMQVWGFKHVTTAFVWVKLNPSGVGFYSGLGYWTNGNIERVLLGKRGSPKRVARDVKQLVFAPRGNHSEKPALVRSLIVRLIGDVPRIELFARERCPGWHAWGNEVESDISW